MKLHVQEIPLEKAPHLHRALEELAHQAGMKKPLLAEPSIKSLTGHARDFMLPWMALAGRHLETGGAMVVLGDGIRGLLGHISYNSPVTPELRAVIAHELSHLKHNDEVLGQKMRFAPHAGALAALAGYALYKHLHQQTPTDLSDAERKQHLASRLDEEIHAAQTENPYAREFFKMAKYVAAGLGGLIAGTVALKLFHNHIEFRADRFSAELMGTGKPLANALTLVSNKYEEFGPNITFTLKDIFKSLISHPPVETRIERLHAM